MAGAAPGAPARATAPPPPSRGEPVVLVHGLAGSTRWWRRNLAALAERHPVHPVDMPRFGARRGGERFVLAEAAGWLATWMGAQGIGRAHLVGHSMGAGICLRLAAAHPERVGRLVLVAPAGLGAGRHPVSYLLPLLATGAQAGPALLLLLARDALRAGPWTVASAARDLLAGDLGGCLARVAAPTLLVWGEGDRLVPPSLADAFLAGLPDARLLRLARAGHVPMFERPAAFNRAALAFLAGERVGPRE